MPQSRTGFLIIDPQPLVGRGLAALLRDEVGVNVFIGSGRSELIAAEMADYLPGVVIIGINGSDTGQGLEAIGIIHQVDPQCRVMVLIDPNARLEAADLVRLGITSVVSRNASLDEVVLAVRQLLAGHKSLDGQMTARLLAELTTAVSRSEGTSTPNGLTRRELQVLELVGDGLPNRDVALRLHISENTVKNHMRSIHEKLGVRTRTEAVVKAAREGLLGIS